MYNFKCFLQLTSLLGRSFPAKMFLISTPLLGHFGLWFPSVFSRVQRELETMFGCNTGLKLEKYTVTLLKFSDYTFHIALM